jgi:hypothetical protein
MCSSGKRPKREEAPPVPIPQILANPFLDTIGRGTSGSASRLGRSSLRIPLLQSRDASSTGNAASAAGTGVTANEGEAFVASTFGARDRKINFDKSAAEVARREAEEKAKRRKERIAKLDGRGGRR